MRIVCAGITAAVACFVGVPMFAVLFPECGWVSQSPPCCCHGHRHHAARSPAVMPPFLLLAMAKLHPFAHPHTPCALEVHSRERVPVSNPWPLKKGLFLGPNARWAFCDSHTSVALLPLGVVKFQNLSQMEFTCFREWV